MNDLTFYGNSWEDYLDWEREDKKKFKKINSLLRDIKRNGAMRGIGKPEKLKYNDGYSRRIDEENRLVYEIDELENIKIMSCKGHYEE